MAPAYSAAMALRRRPMLLATVAAAGVPRTYAPPATVFLHRLQVQMPTVTRFTECLPQNTQLNCVCTQRRRRDQRGARHAPTVLAAPLCHIWKSVTPSLGGGTSLGTSLAKSDAVTRRPHVPGDNGPAARREWWPPSPDTHGTDVRARRCDPLRQKSHCFFLT